jgi:hypothetical protein
MAKNINCVCYKEKKPDGILWEFLLKLDFLKLSILYIYEILFLAQYVFLCCVILSEKSIINYVQN